MFEFDFGLLFTILIRSLGLSSVFWILLMGLDCYYVRKFRLED